MAVPSSVERLQSFLQGHDIGAWAYTFANETAVQNAATGEWQYSMRHKASSMEVHGDWAPSKKVARQSVAAKMLAYLEGLVEQGSGRLSSHESQVVDATRELRDAIHKTLGDGGPFEDEHTSALRDLRDKADHVLIAIEKASY